jgi:hypothetical protein
MRAAVLVLATGFVGCAKPQPAEVPAAAPVEVAPPPLEVPSDPHTAYRSRCHRESDVPLLRALARREIRPGDDIEPLVARFPECHVLRHGPYVALSFSHGRGGTGVTAKNGKVVGGGTGSCTYHDVFFSTLTEAEREDCRNSYHAVMHRWYACRDTLPAAVGVPASILVWHRPSDR